MLVEHIKADLEREMGDEFGEGEWAPFQEYCLSALENHGEYAYGSLACHWSMHFMILFTSHNTFHLSWSVAQAKVTKAMPAYHCFFFFEPVIRQFGQLRVLQEVACKAQVSDPGPGLSASHSNLVCFKITKAEPALKGGGLLKKESSVVSPTH